MISKKINLTVAIIIASGLFSLSGCSNIDNAPSETVNIIESHNVVTESIYEQESDINTTTQKIEYEPAIDPNAPVLKSHLKFQGRHLYKNDIQWLVQSGSAAEFTVTGTNVSIVITNISSINNYSSRRPRYAVFLDGKLIRDKVITAPEENLILFEEDSPRTANVKVMLLSEAAYGAVGIKSIDVIGGEPESIKPLSDKELAIEFIGDSITCGYGVDSDDGDEAFSTATENFSKSYAYIAAEELKADYSVVAYSGYGVISGYSSGEKNTEDTVPQYYDTVSIDSSYNEKWDFSERKIDAVVINLGTNDTGYVYIEDKDTCDEFVNGYVSFLEDVRKVNPDAAIICTVGLMDGGETIYPLIQKAVKKFDDNRTTCFLSMKMDTEKNGAGAGWHPSEKTQKEYGHIIAEEIRKAISK